MKASVRLAIVADGVCDPYRRVVAEESEEDAEHHICTECRHHEEVNTHSDNIEWRYRCLRAPVYEEHVNYINGDAMFFDREGWEELRTNRRKWGDDWRPKASEKDYFHTAQRYESCWKRNADGLCEDYEPTRAVVAAETQTAAKRRWESVRPTLVGLVVGGVLGIAGALAGLLGS